MRGDELVRAGGPNSLQYVSQLFAETGLADATGAVQPRFQKQLRILSRALAREFGDRVAIQIVDPWSLQGLWFCARHRVRSFPCLVIAKQYVSLEISQKELLEIIRQALDEES